MGKNKYSIDSILINSPKVKDFTKLDLELQQFITELEVKENPVLRIKGLFGYKRFQPKYNELWELKWIDLIELRYDLESQDLQSVIKKLYDISDRELLQISIINFKACLKWITNQLESIANTEVENLKYETSPEELEAGVEELQKYDYYVTLDGLTGGDATKEDYYLNKPYSFIFRKLCLMNDKRLINERIHDIISRKNKAN